MQDFTIQELYEISDGLSERRTRLLQMREVSNTHTLDRLIDTAQSAHTKVMLEIVNRTSFLP